MGWNEIAEHPEDYQEKWEANIKSDDVLLRYKTRLLMKQEKERLYQEALRQHEAIIKALKEEVDADKERLDYLKSLNILLQRAVEDLQHDLGVA